MLILRSCMDKTKCNSSYPKVSVILICLPFIVLQQLKKTLKINKTTLFSMEKKPNAIRMKKQKKQTRIH